MMVYQSANKNKAESFFYQFQKALGSCVVISPFICKVLLAHFIYTLMNKSHETTDGTTHFRLQENVVAVQVEVKNGIN